MTTTKYESRFSLIVEKRRYWLLLRDLTWLEKLIVLQISNELHNNDLHDR